ncbi:amidohydrolase family protein [Mycobacterium tuberculosis]
MVGFSPWRWGTAHAGRRGIPDAIVVPGFVDMHVHGGGGASFADGNAADIARAAEFHLRHGTTTTLASLVTAGPAELLFRRGRRPQLGTASSRIHLEGPWLSPARCGAHRPHPDACPGSRRDRVGARRAADGAVRMVTLAPERLEAMRRSGACRTPKWLSPWAYGRDLHTDPTRHRPGRDSRHPPVQRDAAAGPSGARTRAGVAVRPAGDRRNHRRSACTQHRGVHAVIGKPSVPIVAVVIDAIAAAGCGDGAFRLGTMPIEVESSVARVAGASTLAGSTTTMDCPSGRWLGSARSRILPAMWRWPPRCR